MEIIGFFIIGFEVLIFLAVIIALCYLVAKRLEDRSQETFEHREN